MNELLRKLYLGELFRKDVPAYSIPARATDYHYLSSAVMFDVALEPFIDETVQYEEDHRKADVHVDFELYNDSYHGFDKVNPRAEASKKATAFLLIPLNMQ